MTNENTENRNSVQKSQNSIKNIYNLSERYEELNNNNNKSDNIQDINQISSEELKNSNEICVDISDTTTEDEIPEEIWEQEADVQITERKLNGSQTADKYQESVINSFEQQNQKNNQTSKDIGSTILCFGYKLSQFKWINIIYLVVLHLYAIYAYGYVLLFPIRLLTVIWTVVLATLSGFGASAGAHRLWAHRAFKARAFLKFLLILLETLAVNGSCYSYARDHRNHHKFVDTDADPKNAQRGFFFAHIGWWCVKKNDQVIKFGKKLPKQDLLDDTLLMIQHKFYIPMVLFWALIFPIIIPYYVWNEDLLTAFNVCVILRVVFVLHHLFTVNSIAHIFGKRPYDKNIGPTESKLTMYLSLGEGSHNYHHSFPMDYANCEKKWWEVFNPSTLFIDICEKLGLAYDLKKPSNQVVQGIIQRKGDPEYFEGKMKRSLCTRIVLGLIDWVFGFIVALWPVWIVLIIKLIVHLPIIVYDSADLAWNN